MSSFRTLDPSGRCRGEWAVLEESSNGSAWRYEVQYTCGARCAGRARVLALDGTREHRVIVAHRACGPPPALPWPLLCGASISCRGPQRTPFGRVTRGAFVADEWDTETVVTGAGDGEGARLEETVAAKCSWWGAISGGCARCLVERRDAHFMRLHALFSTEEEINH